MTVTDSFGHDQWLHFWQIRQLRRTQLQQKNKFDPSRLYLDSLSDPRAHIKYMKETAQQQFNQLQGQARGAR